MSSAPNILLIMVDELAPQALPTYGHPLVKAPHVAALADRGVVFDAAYTNSPLCAPARAAMLAGRWIPGIGAWDNGAEWSSETPCMPHYLRHLGYSATLSGKMHMIGPDQLHGYETRLTTDIYPADFSWTANWSRPPTDPNPAGVSMRPVLEAGHCQRNLQIDYDEEVHHQATQWLWDRARNTTDTRPFFLTVSYTHPHPPFDAQIDYWNMYRDEDIPLPRVPALPPQLLDPASLGLYHNHMRDRMPVTKKHMIAARRAYFGMVTWIDERIGDLLRTLEASGLDRNTVIVFTSDHGEMLGERGMWFKMCMFEWSVRIPLIVAWPGGFAPRRVAQNVSLVDLLPTFLDLGSTDSGAADPTVEALDGRSLRSLLETGVDASWSDQVISDFAAGGVPGPLRMVKRGQWKLIRIGGHPPLLFDLASDPDELVDRSNDPAARDVLASLLATAPDGYDPVSVDAAVRLSQRRRLLIRGVNEQAPSPTQWNWKVRPEDDRRFVRGGGARNGEHPTKARARFPYVCAADGSDSAP